MNVESFERSELWLRTLAIQEGNDPDNAARAKLRVAYLSTRNKVRVFADEIHRDLPNYTVHNISHIDSLWESASLIAGNDYPVNPLEGFVLGCAFLFHDLGMALAAYRDRLDTLRNEGIWKDTFAQRLNALQCDSEVETIVREGIERETDVHTLRVLHAQRAEELASNAIEDANGASIYLIEDEGIRRTYGLLIGRIAKSHHQDVELLPKVFTSTIGAYAGDEVELYWPLTWTIEPLKLACLLRLADGTQIDARRAPYWLMALRRPSGESLPHWQFQGKLNKPYEQDGRIVFTSCGSFARSDFSAWWMCFDVLKTLDYEFRSVDSMLADLNLPRLLVKSVAGVEDPRRLMSNIQTTDWLPVNTMVRVSDVPRLARMLGGEQLYGRNPFVPIRELIQNSGDALRARCILEGRAPAFGKITVRLGSDEHGRFIEVEDNGIGMKESLLTGAFLDFGSSYWTSVGASQDHPSLFQKGFKPTGKYGIGFFSVFMIGDHVRVSSRAKGTAECDTHVLEFSSGLTSRALIRAAHQDECLIDPGTRIRVYIREDKEKGVSVSSRYRHLDDARLQIDVADDLRKLLQYYCPALEFTLVFEVDGNPVVICSANDWLDLNSETFFERLLLPIPPQYKSELSSLPEKALVTLRSQLADIVEADGTIVGRGSLKFTGAELPWQGAICVDGMRYDETSHVVGIVKGKPDSATRNEAISIVSEEAMLKWYDKQVSGYLTAGLPSKQLFYLAVVVGYRFPVSNLPVCIIDDKYLTSEEFCNHIEDQEEIHLYDTGFEIEHEDQSVYLSYGSDDIISEVQVPIGAIVTDLSGGYPHRKAHLKEEAEREYGGGLEAQLARLACKVWGCTLEELLEVSSIGDSRSTSTLPLKAPRFGLDEATVLMDCFKRPRKG